MIPNSVTSIASYAFYNCARLTSVMIPDSVISIAGFAFYSCSNLTSVTIGNSVTSIGSAAFQSCSSLTSVTIPNSVTSIGIQVFYNCTSLISVKIGNSVTSIADYVFYNCTSLTSVMIPNSVTSIGYQAFYNCTSLTSVTIPNGVTSIQGYTFYNCTSLISVTIGNSVTIIGDHAFYNCSSLTSVTIPNSVTSIASFAFYNCSSLTSITIPNSVIAIGDNAFNGCTNLTSVTIPNSVTSIQDFTFYNCTSLTSVTIPNSATYIGYRTFYNCTALTSVTIPNSVTYINSYAFYNCISLTSVTIPTNVTSIADSTFYNCSSLTGVYFQSNAPSIGSTVFSGANNATVYYLAGTMGWGTTFGGRPAVLWNPLVPYTYTTNNSTITITKYIGPGGAVTVPVTINGLPVTSIGSAAFAGCTSLTAITVDASNSVYSSVAGVLFNKSQTTLIQCPGDKSGSYTAPSSVTNIGSYAFYYCISLTSVTIPNSVTSIGDWAFGYCTRLTAVYFQGNAPGVGSSVFTGADNAVVYYLPGTTGWGTTFGGRPAVLQGFDTVIGTDGVSNLQIYQYNLTHTDQLDPRNPFFAPGTSIYEVLNNGQHTNRIYYDRDDRLVGEEFSRGISIAYQYDGNGNLIRQAYLSRVDERTNGLPILWRFLNGLTNSANCSPYADSDGDGWNNYQEWKAGTDPNNSQSTPNLLGNPGTNIASLTAPFTPSNFVVGVGQLDGFGAEEIVIGADGDPGTSTNFLLVLTQGATTWSTQRVDVGQFGITSIAIGQPANRPGPAIYAGLRGTTNGSGRVMEFLQSSGAWTSSVVTLSTNQAAFVLGVRPSADLLVSLASTNGSDGTLYSASFLTNWNLTLFDTNISHRGLGTLYQPQPQITAAGALRPLDSGGIVTVGVTQNSVWASNLVSYWNLDGASQDALGSNKGTDSAITYSSANGKINNGAGFNGSNSIIRTTTYLSFTDFTFSAWVKTTSSSLGDVVSYDVSSYGQYFAKMLAGNTLAFYLYHTGYGFDVTLYGSTTINDGRWHFVAATRSGGTYKLYVDGNLDGQTGRPTTATASVPITIGATRNYGSIETVMNGAIDEVGIWSRALSAGEVSQLYGDSYGWPYSTTSVLLSEPQATSRYLWRGKSLAAGLPRSGQMNGYTVYYTFGDDVNGNNRLDTGDDFVTAEYFIADTNTSMLTLSRQRITSPSVAQSYGLASVNYLSQNNAILFTGEPDGQVFAWTAADSTNPLQRQLFSGYHAGKAWHAMSALKTSGTGEGLVGLRVDTNAPNACSVIFWPPQAQLPQNISLIETAPAAAVIPSGNPLGSNAVVTVRLWDNEGNDSTPFLQYQILGSTNWQNSTLTTLDGLAYSLATRVTALPGGFNHILRWNALADVGANIVTNILLRARAQDFALLGDWSQPTPFQLNTAIAINPTNPPVTFTGITPVAGGIRFNWQGSTNAWLYLQRSPALAGTNAAWVNIWTGAPPTLMFGSYTDFFGTNPMGFYRLKVVNP
jgi:YD repeat-containing protein